MDNTNGLKPNGNIISSDTERNMYPSDSDRNSMPRTQNGGRIIGGPAGSEIQDNMSGNDMSGNGMTSCIPDDAQIMGDSLAMVYSPKQYFADIYTEEEALGKGTLFKKLYKPLEAVGGDE
ncbi:MAG: spore coat associated protein CotJA [Eubacteriales bacterium]|nr:spore coat associated protein CotJA [Eubacteriales bacterium]